MLYCLESLKYPCSCRVAVKLSVYVECIHHHVCSFTFHSVFFHVRYRILCPLVYFSRKLFIGAELCSLKFLLLDFVEFSMFVVFLFGHDGSEAFIGAIIESVNVMEGYFVYSI